MVDAEEWEEALNSSMLLADMFEVDTECVGDRLGQVDLLLEQVLPSHTTPPLTTNSATTTYIHAPL